MRGSSMRVVRQPRRITHRRMHPSSPLLRLTWMSVKAASFNQARTGCILVRFDAVSLVQGSGGVEFVTALLDGTQMFPGEMAFDGDNEQVPQSRATSWVATNVSAGSHSVQIQYRSFNGQTVIMSFHTTAIWHR